ncbi:hypothetical protein PISL3812_00400 [Talaromyces islandicus]|uniref:Mitochondrial ATP synthase epsilon chain domain-containing protein n=1 Tax=Talaromyces islandicus TaxID=28573 RepID=A0A0U1LJV5_TALIS|nr:hypothetical protein PISL3812_00400 [Talaromyces islandicus]
MSAPWKAAGLTYNRYLAVAAGAVRRSLKDGPRLVAERRGLTELKFAKWENGKQGDVKQVGTVEAAAQAEK